MRAAAERGFPGGGIPHGYRMLNSNADNTSLKVSLSVPTAVRPTQAGRGAACAAHPTHKQPSGVRLNSRLN